MKQNSINKVFLFFALFIAFSCQQQEKQVYYQTDDEFAKRERFDMDDFWRYQQEYNFFFIRNNSVFVEQFGDGNYYSEKRYYMNGRFCICDDLLFYPTGEVKSKKRFISSFPEWTRVTSEIKGQHFPVGKEYEFNHDGIIMKIVDYDNCYKYTLEDILIFIEEHQIEQPNLYRTTDTLKIHYWEILSELSLSSRIYHKFHLHGVTGEIIQDTTFLNPW